MMAKLYEKDGKKMMRKFHVFFQWQDKEHEEWLNELSQAGWDLVKTGLFYTFEKREDGPYRYELDYYEIKKGQAGDYFSIFEEAGWELVCSSMGWHYFRILEEQYEMSIYSDVQSKIEMFQRMEASSFIFVIFFILFVDFDWIGNLSDVGMWMSMFFQLFLFAGFIGFLVSGIAIYGRIKELKDKTIEEDEL